jgi:zinc/manganese transport system substrate-binding protein
MKIPSARRPLPKLARLAPVLAGALLLGACSAPQGTTTQGNAGSGTISVVASTSVYGDIVKAVGGEKVSVTSVISKQSQDPHSYEATTQDRVAVSKARLVVLNGHGYDDFMLKLADEAKLPADSLLNAVDASGLLPSPTAAPGWKDEFNEHIWYSTDAMKKVADTIAQKLAALDPTDSQSFKDRAAQWEAKLKGISGKLDAIKAAHRSEAVAVTEPVPLYMLEAAGLENKTPEAFSAAVEAGNDVPPAALKQMQDLISSHQVAFLAHNPQTETPQTQALKKFAQDAHVPVVDFTETMPEGIDYITWMTDNADALSTALGTTK